ncbi:MAG: hypothetical protein WCC59_00105 [Terriglobales bacterium]
MRTWKSSTLLLPPLLLLLLLVLSSLPAAAQAKLEKLPALKDTSVPAAIRAALDASGSRLVRPDGSVLCEIWLRKSLPVGRVAAAKGAAYPEMSESALLGVISFPNGGKDFRGQAIKPGLYTMRYELLPEDGNHMGVSPTRDFVLLLAASADNDPDAQYDFAQLVKLSAQAAGTNHPAPFVLLAPENNPTPSASLRAGSIAPNPGSDKGGATAASSESRTYQNPDGFQVFAGAIQTDGGKNVPIALVVKGQAEQ